MQREGRQHVSARILPAQLSLLPPLGPGKNTKNKVPEIMQTNFLRVCNKARFKHYLGLFHFYNFVFSETLVKYMLGWQLLKKCFFLVLVLLKKRFQAYSKIERKVKKFPIHPYTYTASPIISIGHQRGIFVATDEPRVTRHYHPRPTVYIRFAINTVHSMVWGK